MRRNGQIFCIKQLCDTTNNAHSWLIERSSNENPDLALEVDNVEIGKSEPGQSTTIHGEGEREDALAPTTYRIKVKLEVLLQIYRWSNTMALTILSQPPPRKCLKALNATNWQIVSE